MQDDTASDAPARILVADNDVVLRECAIAHLAAHSSRIDVAVDGAEAWDKINAQSFDLVLVGLDLPNVGALELVMRMRARPALRHVPVMVIVGRDDMFAIDRAFELGVTAFSSKPVSWPLLTYQIRCALRASRAEAAMREARNRAEEAISIRDNMLRLLRHEMRTPLNAILGFANLIETGAHGPVGDPAYHSYAAHIREAGERLLASLTEMLLFAQLIAGEAELSTDDYCLGPLVVEAIARVEPKARQRHVEIEADGLEAIETHLPCDRQLLVCAVRNLIDNAVVHGRIGGSVAVAARVGPGSEVIIDVRDEGPGMTAEEIGRCCEPFYQGDMSWSSRKGGLGLGLAMAQRIVALHGGTLTLISSPGTGTVARIVLPRQSDDAQAQFGRRAAVA
jgi:two-component system sensor histidine kinase/response regulator